MIIHPIASAPHDVDVLMWDVLEREWRIGHIRGVLEGVEPFHVACTVREASDLISDDNPIPVFMEASHWAALPMPVQA